MIGPLGKSDRLKKPLIAVVHGDTWNMGHELHLVADIRVASADTRFGQDENTHGRFPGGGSTIRFPREDVCKTDQARRCPNFENRRITIEEHSENK
jgi:enoyl-CoA hydratase